MKIHPFDILTLEDGAQLIFTPCPGTKEANLEDAVTQLKQVGTQILITLMFDEEVAKNNAKLLSKTCVEQDVTWMQLPMPDDAAPNRAFESQWEIHKADILNVLNNKGTVAVHCKGGSGRTGLAIGLILLALGWSGDKVIEEVQKLRPKALKHPVQLDYFNSYL